jgi:prepilin-type N-terminal cleavage/methylation domain-containing protein
MKNEQGFSLVELLIVVAIIAIVAAIAIPSLLTSRQAANEAGAIQGCRTIGSAEIAFAATNNQQYTDVTTLVTGNFLDTRFNNAANAINGYTYAASDVPGTAMDGAPPGSFQYVALPSGSGMGRFSYGIGPDQVVRYVSAISGASLPSGVSAGDPIGRTY